MARREVFKRIKDDILIENRIQIYRVHFNYLQTCLKYPKEFKVNKSKYRGWDLDKVKTHKFDSWWNKIGRDLMGKELRQIRPIKTSSFNPRENTTVLEIPNDNPTEYSLDKIRQILNSTKVKEKKRDKRIHHVNIEIYLESWKYKREDKLSISQTVVELEKKRTKLLKERGRLRVAMDKTRTDKFLKVKEEKRDKDVNFKKKLGLHLQTNNLLSLNRQVSRFNLKAKRILHNVCNGEFPGDYTDD